MNSELAKLVVSRQKSIKAIEVKIANYESMLKTATPSATVALQGVLGVNRQRLAKLKEELAGLEQLAVDDRQAELPGAGRPVKR